LGQDLVFKEKLRWIFRKHARYKCFTRTIHDISTLSLSFLYFGKRYCEI